jgi:Skp family chaperone for outer membrane proteins
MNSHTLKSLLAATLLAGAASAVPAQELKIGYVNSDRVLREAVPAKAAQTKLEAEFSKREKDLNDLFDIRVMGRPVEFTAETQRRYDDLVSQGKRYQKVSWVAFGAAGVAFATATLLFVTSRDHAESPPPVSLDVTGDGATVGTGFRF